MMLSILILSVMMVISSTNLFTMWMCLELNLFSFVPLLLNKMSTNESEASINYFLAQTLGSTMFLLFSMMLFHASWLMKLNMTLLMLIILLKMGAAPCHYWYPSTMSMISWMNCFILSTWQKLAPLIILSYIICFNLKLPNLEIIVSLNALTGGLIGMSQTLLKKIMAYSSITHIAWMLSSLLINKPYLSIIYLLLYSMITLPLFILFNIMDNKKIDDLWNKYENSMLTTTMYLFMLSTSGLPPLMGFIPKLMMMNLLMKYSILSTIMLIVGSLMNLFFYLNIGLNAMLTDQYIAQTKMKNPPQLWMLNSLLIMSLSSMVMITLYALTMLI